jgi:hypothetical protein
MLMELKFRVKNDTKVFNIICRRNIRVVKDMPIVKSQHIRFYGGGNNSCLTSVKLHMICCTILHRVYI